MNDSDLVGQLVMHRKTHDRGTVVAVSGGEISIRFSEQTLKFSYPSAFSSTLIFADEDLQEKVEREGDNAGFEKCRSLYSRSIASEIWYLKTNGGTRYKAIDGEILRYQSNGSYTYTFDTDSELHLQDGIPIKIYFFDRVISAYVVSCEEFTIMIRTQESMGEKVASIEFTAEQWQILEQLMERLTEIDPERDAIAYELACKGRGQINEMPRIRQGQETAKRCVETQPITFIWGPPGTGKTETLADIASSYIDKGMRVLMMSYSNVSVDGAILRLARKTDHRDGKIVRYGYPRDESIIDSALSSYKCAMKMYPDLMEEYASLIEQKRHISRRDPRRLDINKELNAIRSKLQEKEHQIVNKASFVATTVSKAIMDKNIYGQRFDLVIFDEASMAYVPQIIFAGGLAKSRFCCLGDFRQLASIVQNPKDDRLSKDIFSYTGITSAVETGMGHKWLVMLTTQYRMHPEIATFIGENMYGGMLQSGENIYAEKQQIADKAPCQGQPMGLIDLSGMYSVCSKNADGSRINILSALISIGMAIKLSRDNKVGIITPYNAQSRLMFAMIRDLQEQDDRFSGISAATVHQYQGSEKEVIIYDAVDCFRMPFPGTLLSSKKDGRADRLFNVAVSRTEGKFLIVANMDFFRRKRISKELLFTKAVKHLKAEDAIISGDEIISEVETEDNEKSLYYVSSGDDAWNEYIEDIRSAKKSIRIDIPRVLEDDSIKISELENALNDKERNGISIEIRHEESVSLISGLECFARVLPYVDQPVTLIDQSTIWYGEPISAADFMTEGDFITTRYFPCIRFIGKHAARAIQTR